MNPLKTTDWLAQNINNVKILDASWHLQIQIVMHLKNMKMVISKTQFFDLDKNSNQEVSLPHMLPKKMIGKK